MSSSDIDSLLEGVGPRKRRRLSLDDQSESDLELQRPISRVTQAAPKLNKSATQPTNGSTKPLEDKTTFSSLKVTPWIQSTLAALSITRPTPIQAACIPPILDGRDCIGGSRTGSGKTMAFAVPILQRWAVDPTGIYAVVLTPTRELALQIYEQFLALGAPQSLKVLLVTGGADMRAQAIELGRSPHVVIATPGRLADHIRTSGADTMRGLKRARFVVLDEADRLLQAGHGSQLPDVEDCLAALPPATQRQTLLFTATVTPEVRALKAMPRAPGKPPVFVAEVDTQALAVPATLAQRYLTVPVTQREPYLHILLSTPAHATLPGIIIFVNRTTTAEHLEHTLRLLGHRAASLHSRLPQATRTANLARFRARAARILVTTDVASRGLDIPDVALVLNYDVPRDPDTYIHRVGRTARAGRKGTALTLVGQRDVELVLAIEERVGANMAAFEEEGVNVETRVIKDGLKVVGEASREARIQIDEGREVTGRRKKGVVKKR